MKSRQTSFELNPRLVAYTAMAGVALAAPLAAEATIIYSGAVNINIPSTTAGVYLNLATGVNAVTPAGAPGWDFNPWSATNLNLYANNAAEVNNGVISGFAGGTSAILADNLPLGAVIDGTATYGRTSGPETTGTTAFVLNSSANYVGIRFLNETTSQINFGWIQLSTGATLGGQPRSIIGYAYENSGTAITVGAIPEPSTAALLGTMAAGAVGVRAWRRRKVA